MPSFMGRLSNHDQSHRQTTGLHYTRPGRRAFVAKGRSAHGIAKGNVRHYEVTGASWAAIRRAIAGCDTTGGKTMGFTAAGPTTVESFTEYPGTSTETCVRPVK